MKKIEPRNVAELREAMEQLMDSNPHSCPHCASPRQLIKLAAAFGWHSAATIYQQKAMDDAANVLTTIADAQQGFKSRGI